MNYHPILKDYYCKNNNEGKRNPVQGYNLKLLGLRAGVADLLIYYPCGEYCGLWLEVKRNKRYTLSERSKSSWVAQEKFLDIVKRVGYAGHICYGWSDGVRIIEDYLAL